MKKVIVGLMIATSFIFGAIAGGVTQKLNTPQAEKEQITIVKTTNKSEEGLYLEEGQTYIEFSDGSWTIYGNGEYIFQPVDLGDWDYEVENQEQLENIIKTYLSMKNEGVY